MSGFIEQAEAARLLGMSEEQLKGLISRSEIFGYRDGSNWKFKMQELERVADELGITLGAEPANIGGSGIDADLEQLVDVGDLDDGFPSGDGDDAESILVSEEELGRSGETTASTIIGRESKNLPDESDIKLSGDEAGVSDVRLAGTSDIDLLGGSDILAGGSRTKQGDTGDALSVDLELGSGAKSKSDKLTLDSGLKLGGDDALTFDDGFGDDESPTQLASSGSAAAINLGDDDDLVLGSGIGSDITLGAADSGIGLATPTDSGLSLEEEPMELGGSQVESLELGEDDMIELDEDADPEAATQLKGDDDFLLTPVDDDSGEESDSGSQVIALDTEQFEDGADTLLAAGPALLEEDPDLMMGAPLDGGMMPAGAPGLAGQPMMMSAPSLPETPYSIYNVLSLMLIVGLLALSGMMMVDLVRNMWAWDQAIPANRPLMDYILSVIGA